MVLKAGYWTASFPSTSASEGAAAVCGGALAGVWQPTKPSAAAAHSIISTCRVSIGNRRTCKTRPDAPRLRDSSSCRLAWGLRRPEWKLGRLLNPLTTRQGKDQNTE